MGLEIRAVCSHLQIIKTLFRHFKVFMVATPILQYSDKASFSFSIHLLGFDAIYQGWPATGISGAAL
jgi:hypothetical protein